jgi:hypothetical protein
MSAYNFKKRWEGQLLAGSKLTTLRVDRKDGRVPRVGEKFSAFVGMRTKQCRRLFDSIIEKVERISIEAIHGESEFDPLNYLVKRDGLGLSFEQGTKLAQADGFGDLDQFISFFEVEHSIHVDRFNGWLIHWKPIPRDGLELIAPAAARSAGK